jgi:hypothetical protein
MPDVPRMPEAAQALDNLERAVDNYEELTEELYQRLSVVLNTSSKPVFSNKLGSEAPAPETFQSELANRIDHRAVRLQNANNRIRGLIDIVEV